MVYLVRFAAKQNNNFGLEKSKTPEGAQRNADKTTGHGSALAYT